MTKTRFNIRIYTEGHILHDIYTSQYSLKQEGQEIVIRFKNPQTLEEKIKKILQDYKDDPCLAKILRNLIDDSCS